MPCRFQQHDTRCCSPSCWPESSCNSLGIIEHHWASRCWCFQDRKDKGLSVDPKAFRAKTHLGLSWRSWSHETDSENLCLRNRLCRIHPNTGNQTLLNSILNSIYNIQLNKATKRLLTCVLVENPESEESESNKILYCHRGWESSKLLSLQVKAWHVAIRSVAGGGFLVPTGWWEMMGDDGREGNSDLAPIPLCLDVYFIVFWHHLTSDQLQDTSIDIRNHAFFKASLRSTGPRNARNSDAQTWIRSGTGADSVRTVYPTERHVVSLSIGFGSKKRG